MLISDASSGCKEHTFHHFISSHIHSIIQATICTQSWTQKASNKNDMQRHGETQSWVHQPEELHPHVVKDFLHLSLLFNGDIAMQKK